MHQAGAILLLHYDNKQIIIKTKNNIIFIFKTHIL